jgi:hypothetical protein
MTDPQNRYLLTQVPFSPSVAIFFRSQYKNLGMLVGPTAPNFEIKLRKRTCKCLQH